VDSVDDTRPLEALAGQRVVAFCGIGNPLGFRHTLEPTGCEIAGWRAFPDHHQFSTADVAALAALATGCNASMAICTQKDLVKVSQTNLGGVPLWAVAIEMRFQAGQNEFEKALEDVRL
jgi:tetraacyldisaccharide 4'-kinase